MPIKPLAPTLSASVTCSLADRSLTASLVVLADLKTGIAILALRHCPTRDVCASLKLPSKVVVSVPAIAGVLIPVAAIAITAQTLTDLPNPFIFSMKLNSSLTDCLNLHKHEFLMRDYYMAELAGK
jgi:hypothetical protein